MQIHLLKAQKRKNRKRVGRGGKRGNYCGRGIKGQNARSGSSRRLAILDFIKKIPKLQGVTAKHYKKQGVKQFRTVYEIVNVEKIEKHFNEGETVTPQSLIEKKLVRRIKGRVIAVKILGKGGLKKKLKFKGVTMSKSIQNVK